MREIPCLEGVAKHEERQGDEEHGLSTHGPQPCQEGWRKDKTDVEVPIVVDLGGHGACQLRRLMPIFVGQVFPLIESAEMWGAALLASGTWGDQESWRDRVPLAVEIVR